MIPERDIDPNGLVKPDAGATPTGRNEIHLGTNFDRTVSKLPPYVELPGGIQVHPDRLQTYLDNRARIEKKTRGGTS